MESKYYVPDISEFFVGFECEKVNNAKSFSNRMKEIERSIMYDTEQKDTEIIYEKHIIKKNDISFYSLNKHYIDKDLRVKYLNSEDIESLGFEYIDNSNLFRKDNTTISYGVAKNENKYLILLDGRIVFEGIIKNKSELVKLLKMLEVE